MTYIKPIIFEQFEELIFGFSTKIGNERTAPYFFNLSRSVGDDETIVEENRELFFNNLKLSTNRVVFQKQVHGDAVIIVEEPGFCGESDAMITDKKGFGLVVSSGDCTAVFIYDKKNRVIAGVHSGWRGTEKRILEKTLNKLKDEFNSLPEDLFVYIAPSISQINYEVGAEVASQFDCKYLKPANEKYLLDVTGANLDMLKKFGVPERNIQKSNLCSYENDMLLHSYRRDGQKSGRVFGVIAMKEKNAK